MSNKVITLDMLEAHMRRHVAGAHSRIQAHYQQALTHALTPLHLPGVSVSLTSEGERTFSGPTAFFPTTRFSRPNMEELTLELKMVLEQDMPAKQPLWKRALQPWKRSAEPRQRHVRIAWTRHGDSSAVIEVDGCLLRTFKVSEP